MDRSAGDDRVVVRLDDITRSFGDVTVFDGLSWAFSTNEVTAIVGPNGSGKTTLLRVVAGVLDADSGRRRVPTATERPVGYLPQDPRFRTQLAVEETLRYYADLLETDVDVEAAMERVGLLDVRNRRVGQLSGGMRQLLGIAQSLLGEPPVVVLDEPTSGLDPRMRERVFGLVDDISDDETAVIISTHDLAGAARMDYVVLLDRGRIRRAGTPTELLDAGSGDSLTATVLEALSEEPTVQSGKRGGS
ncbi:MAG: ABC transporter ATP-binding protein [Haloplanus sp.]